MPFDRGVLGMARSQDPNSANSQFFIMLQEGHFLNGNYTVFGKVTRGMKFVDAIKKGASDLIITGSLSPIVFPVFLIKSFLSFCVTEIMSVKAISSTLISLK